MKNRRRFLQASAGAAVFSKSVLGANDRINMGIIGSGNRGMQVLARLAQNSDCTFIAACDVAKSRLDQAATKIGGKVDTYSDYQRMLERKDIDAVLVATPDHWHSPITVDACAAGKDVYVEKPVSNTIEAGQNMVNAARRYNRIVEVGLQQRCWKHFQECEKMIKDGLIGQVTHAEIVFPGSYTSAPDEVAEPPADLNWEAFQGPAPRRPFKPSYQRMWRTYYDYGGGVITDWVHLTDVAIWYLNAAAPKLASASAQYIKVDCPERDQVPDAFEISWQYPNFIMSFTNKPMNFSDMGTYLHGDKGIMFVDRNGYKISPISGGMMAAMRGGPAPKGIEAKTFVAPDDQNMMADAGTAVIARDFLDCVKSRNKPACDIEAGFNSTLPSLLALLSIRQERMFRWDDQKAWPA